MTKRTIVSVGLCLGLTFGAQQTASADRGDDARSGPRADDPVLVWNETAADAAIAAGITPIFDPLHESRLYAMTQVAVHDALNTIDRRYQPYALHADVQPDADTDAAVATAAHDVLVPVLGALPDLFPPAAAIELVEGRYTAALAAIPDSPAKGAGIDVGRAAARAVLDGRADDGSDRVFLDTDYPEGTEPGQYRYVEGAPFAVAPRWGEVTPFVMTTGSELRPRPPDDLTSEQYASDFNELKSLGAIDGSARTPEQTEVGYFWFEASPLRWNRIGRTAAGTAGLDMWENARLFGLMNLALADGYIGNWDAKYHYNRWRPETAVRLADTDDNPATEADPTWTPLWGSSGATPEYDSGHTIEGYAAAEILRRVIGTDYMTFSVCSYTLPTNTCNDPSPQLRTYTSFSEAAAENGYSRILVGWHFRNAVEQGAKHGTNLGELALCGYMRPTR